ncbi:hypothetical protein ADUPG1_001444, partial [Aduncisulcus paluster]
HSHMVGHETVHHRKAFLPDIRRKSQGNPTGRSCILNPGKSSGCPGTYCFALSAVIAIQTVKLAFSILKTTGRELNKGLPH